MKYQWYMTNNRDYRFESFEYAKNNGFKVSDYDLAQEGQLTNESEIPVCSDNDALEELYANMNLFQKNHPGVRSMSMSDIVVLSEDDGWNVRAYYCDDFGWTKLDFWKDM